MSPALAGEFFNHYCHLGSPSYISIMWSNRYQKPNFKKLRAFKIADCIQIDSSHGFEAMFKGIDFYQTENQKEGNSDLYSVPCY